MIKTYEKRKRQGDERGNKYKQEEEVNNNNNKNTRND